MNKIVSIRYNKTAQRYGLNVFWLLVDKVIKLALGLVVTIWVARYLGPNDFGILSYVFAFVALLAPFSKLGLDGIVSRDIAKNDYDISELLSSAVLLKIIGSIGLLLISVCYMTLAKDDKLYVYLVIICSLVFFVRSFEVIEFYFRARVIGHKIVVANVIGVVISSVLKIAFILMSFSLMSFAIANLIEAILAMSLMVLLFVRTAPEKISFEQVSTRRIRALLAESWPIMLSGFFALVYLNVDQIMIESMLNSHELGQYAAAARISSACYFIPMTIGWALQSALVRARKTDSDQYFKRLKMLASALSLLAYCIVLPVSYFSGEIIDLLYGADYFLSAGVLSIHMWASIFVFVGSVRGLWIVNESYFKFALFANVVAGFLNILLNYLWLPIYGIEGAAWATLISYAFTYVLSGLFYKPVFKILGIQIGAMTLWFLMNTIANSIFNIVLKRR